MRISISYKLILAALYYAAIGTEYNQAWAKTNDCARIAEKKITADLTYKFRKDRCEGIYLKNYSLRNPNDFIVGFLSHPISLPVNGLGRVNISIDAKHDGPAQLIVADTIPTKYYQMDRFLDAGQDTFSWDLSVISNPSISLGGNDLAAIACAENCNQVINTLLPVSISETGEGHNSSKLVLFERPLEMTSLKIVLTDLVNGGVLHEIEASEEHLSPSQAQIYRVPQGVDAREVLLSIFFYLDDKSSINPEAILVLK